MSPPRFQRLPPCNFLKKQTSGWSDLRDHGNQATKVAYASWRVIRDSMPGKVRTTSKYCSDSFKDNKQKTLGCMGFNCHAYTLHLDALDSRISLCNCAAIWKFTKPLPAESLQRITSSSYIAISSKLVEQACQPQKRNYHVCWRGCCFGV